MKRFVPLSIPNFNGNEKKYVDDALEQGWVSTGGAYITRLEQQLAEFLKVDRAAACQSGTSGLHLALVECGVQPGDMVIVPTLTFIAAVNPVRYQFAEPVFMDCDESLCLDPEKLAEFCEKECKLEAQQLVHKKSGRVVKAVIVVHVFGNLADMEAIMSIAGKYHLKLAGRYAGTIGDFGVYSFNGNKIITTGGGGAVTARCADEVEHLKYLSTQAKDDPQFYIHNEIGYNYRMTNLQAALGVAQMEELQQFIETKHRNYILYKERFREVSFGTLLPFREGTCSNQWFYSLQLREDRLQGKDMRDIIGALQERGIQTRAIWGLIHEQKPYRQNIAYKIEKAPCYSATVLNIPSSTQLTEEDICYAAEQITEVLGGDEG